MEAPSQTVSAMAFYHKNGFVPAFTQAMSYAGSIGRVGTMLDWVDARLAMPPYEKLGMHDPSNPTPWDQYYTTMSAEYVGISKGGTKILIVAHGVGPMATLDGVVEAYRYHYSDKTRRIKGGRISMEEFRKLESGDCGDVEIVDLEAYIRAREYPFITTLHYTDAVDDPVLKARLGPRAKEYILEHASNAMLYHTQEHDRLIPDPYILTVGGPGMYWVKGVKPEDGLVYAHLLSVGGIMNVHVSQSEHRVPSWVSDISTHGWHDGTRLIGIRGGRLISINKGPDPYRLLRKHWRELLVPTGCNRPLPGGFYNLIEVQDGVWFTRVHKSGGRMDNVDPEYPVTSIEPIGEPVRFYTPIQHYHGFFKYAMSEVRRLINPCGANAYALVGEPENVWKDGNPVEQTCLVQPYRIEIDHTKRLMQEEVLANDFEKMMQLYGE